MAEGPGALASEAGETLFFTPANLDRLYSFVHRTFGHQRFTQDSPIRPDVWIRLWKAIVAAKHGEARNARVDMIITPEEGVEPGEVAIMIERMLHGSDREAIDKLRKAAGLSYGSTTVVAKLTFDEMLAAVVPLTAWWTKASAQNEARPAQSLGADVGPFQRLRRYLEKDGSEPGATIDDAIRRQGASYQFYRFAALAVFTENLIGARVHYDATKLATSKASTHAAKQRRRLVDLKHNVLSMVDELSNANTPLSVFRASRYVDTFEKIGSQVTKHSDRRTKAPENTSGEATLVSESLEPSEVSIHAVFANRTAESLVALSRKTVKADAAASVFGVDTTGIVWAVVDSGIDREHPAFARRDSSGLEEIGHGSRVRASYDLTYIRELLATATLPETLLPVTPDPPKGGDEDDASAPAAVADTAGSSVSSAHSGDGRAQRWAAFRSDVAVRFKGTLESLRKRRDLGRQIDWEMLEPLIRIPHDDKRYRPPRNEHGTHVAGIIAADWPKAKEPGVEPEEDMKGLCPKLELIDIRAFDDQGNSTEDIIIKALEFIAHKNRGERGKLAIHGVNLSIAVGADVRAFACGRTPVCEACNALVEGGTVVVAAAGNSGFEGDTRVLSMGQNVRDISITDPGNADLVITVGATHREKPHTYGVSYFSSRGPTADGRMKPDLVAPGEKIHSTIPNGGAKTLDGTSMAAPHVSGVAALLIARHRELVGQPRRVKEILCKTATDLGRERSFQGAGLVDALRALQSV